MTKNNPTLNDFYNDMNQHGMAEYRRIGGRYVIELDSMPSGKWAITVWEAVKNNESYIPAEIPDNRYEWDAVGRNFYPDYDAGKEGFRDLSGVKAVRRFCEANPYDGARTPYNERE